MYRIPYAAENLVSFDQDDGTAGLCFSKDFHDAGYSGYIREEDGPCQALQVESYGSLTMSTEDHLKKVRRARRLAAPQDPGSTNSLASGPTTVSPAFSSPQSYGSPQEGTSVGINFGQVRSNASFNTTEPIFQTRGSNRPARPTRCSSP